MAIVAVVAALAAVARPTTRLVTRHVERVNVTGVITDDRAVTDSVRRLAKDGSVAAVIVSIDSPGGSVAGGESLYDAIRDVAAARPTIAVMRGTAASAGYMVALPTNRIFAQQSTLTGSIGVILETAEFSGLLKTLGVDAEAITSGPLKDQPSLSRPLSPEGRAYLNGVVQDMFDQFVEKVAQGRHMTTDAVRQLADGRAYTGRQAKALGLVDEIGGEAAARSWLASTYQVDETLPVRDLDRRSFVQRTFGSALTGLRLMMLDGLGGGAWSLWTGR